MEHIEGRHPVLEAFRAGRKVTKLFLVEGARGSADEVLALARSSGVPVTFLPRRELDAMAQGRVHQGVIALAEPRAYQDLEAILGAAAEAKEPPFVIALDGVEDPRNLGSIIRTAVAAGVHGVVIPERRSATLTPAAVKAAAGTSDLVAIAREVNLARSLERLKEKGLWTVGADAGATKTYTEVDLTLPVALVVGGEHQGLRRLVREKCDFLVRIPMAPKVNSLNAGVAAAILLYEVVRQRSARSK